MLKEEIKNKFAQINEVSDEIILARNNSTEFYRILRKSQNYENANIKTFGDKKTYEGTTLNNVQEIVDKIEYYRNNDKERFKPKDDKNGTNICDNPGFGSVRLSPPYEDINFDRQYFEFINLLISDSDIIVDYGGGTGLFLGCLTNKKSKKILVEKNDVFNIPNYNIEYVDSDEFDFSKKYDYIYCYHCIEHLSEPEKTIKDIIKSTSKICFFATPLKELLLTSYHHYIYVEASILVNLLRKINAKCWIHISKHYPLDIHWMVINDSDTYKKIKDVPFFKENWKYFENYSSI